jgi:hypothetical protein
MEREIQVAGHWLVFMLILGMVLAICGITGTAIGLAYAHPSQAAAHSILHPLARISVILGPIALLGGAAMLLGSAYGMRGHRGSTRLTMAPLNYKELQTVSSTELTDEQEEGEMPAARSGWRKSY